MMDVGVSVKAKMEIRVHIVRKQCLILYFCILSTIYCVKGLPDNGLEACTWCIF